MATKSGKRINVKAHILIITILPLLFTCTVITAFACWTMNSGLQKQVLDNLKSTASGALLSMDSISDGDFNVIDDELYKGDFNITQNMDALDSYAKYNDSEVTFFYGDTRRATTIKDKSGKRIVGTKASDEVINAVLKKGQDFTSNKVEINNEEYYVYYMPIKDSDDNIIGMAFAGKKKAEVKAFILSRISTLLVIVVLNCISCVFVASAVSKNRFVQPIKQLKDVAEGLAVGDIDQKITVNSNDEFGDLADSFTALIENVEKQAHVAHKMAEGDLTVEYTPASDKDVMGKAIVKMLHDNNRSLMDISHVSDRMVTGVNEISSASNALANGTTSQASAIEEITASIVGISDSAKINAQDATEANELVIKTKEVAIHSNEQMHDMISAMHDINKSSQNISSIMKLIDDIAVQTNIIALNASVEAARAGVHGKGFAVVASEIRKLAAESADAAKNSEMLVEDSIKKASKGTDIATETAASLEEILQSVETMASLVSRIATASNDQAYSVGQVNTGITQISDVVQMNSATSEECAATSDELSNLAGQLKSAVHRYRLNG